MRMRLGNRQEKAIRRITEVPTCLDKPMESQAGSVTNHSVPGRSRAPVCSPLPRSYCPARSRRAGPVVFRILPLKF
jgi:hypothetical protein